MTLVVLEFSLLQTTKTERVKNKEEKTKNKMHISHAILLKKLHINIE